MWFEKLEEINNVHDPGEHSYMLMPKLTLDSWNLFV